MGDKKISLGVKIGKLSLRNPLVLASGTAGYGTELRGLLNFNKVGAVATKTITLKPKEGNPPPRIAESSCGVLNSIGLENPGIDRFLSQWQEIKGLKTQIIVSIYGETKEEFAAILSKLEKIGQIKAVELNLSCPNVTTRKMISQSAKSTYSLIKYLRNKTGKILIAKLTPEVTDIVEIARASREAGIDCLSLVNTFIGMKIDLAAKRPLLGNIYGGLSGPAIKPLALYKVFKVYQSLKIPIIASGGISDYRDVLEFILAGASCLGVGTANLIDPQIATVIIGDLISYMRRNKILSLNEIRGKAHGRTKVA